MRRARSLDELSTRGAALAGGGVGTLFTVVVWVLVTGAVSPPAGGLVWPTLAAFGGAGALVTLVLIAVAKRADLMSDGGSATCGEPEVGWMFDVHRDATRPSSCELSSRSEE